MTSIYLLRHGEIESDGIKRFYGQSDVRLNLKGFEQARLWRDNLMGTPFDGIYASDLSRCAETARIVSETGETKIQVRSELREIHLGKLEGLAIDAVRRQLPKEWLARGEDMAGYTPEGGESFIALQHRVIPWLHEVSRRHEGNVLAVTHAGVNRVILCNILGMPLKNLFQIEQSYGCLNLLSFQDGHFRVKGVNLKGLP